MIHRHHPGIPSLFLFTQSNGVISYYKQAVDIKEIRN